MSNNSNVLEKAKFKNSNFWFSDKNCYSRFCFRQTAACKEKLLLDFNLLSILCFWTGSRFELKDIELKSKDLGSIPLLRRTKILKGCIHSFPVWRSHHVTNSVENLKIKPARSRHQGSKRCAVEPFAIQPKKILRYVL